MVDSRYPHPRVQVGSWVIDLGHPDRDRAGRVRAVLDDFVVADFHRGEDEITAVERVEVPWDQLAVFAAEPDPEQFGAGVAIDELLEDTWQRRDIQLRALRRALLGDLPDHQRHRHGRIHQLFDELLAEIGAVRAAEVERALEEASDG